MDQTYLLLHIFPELAETGRMFIFVRRSTIWRVKTHAWRTHVALAKSGFYFHELRMWHRTAKQRYKSTTVVFFYFPNQPVRKELQEAWGKNIASWIKDRGVNVLVG